MESNSIYTKVINAFNADISFLKMVLSSFTVGRVHDQFREYQYYTFEIGNHQLKAWSDGVSVAVQ